jgi:hypothetical protein
MIMLVLRRLGLAVWMGVAILVASVVPAAAKASVDRIENVDSVLAVATPEDFPVASLMRAECAWVQRVELPDGSATESQACDLSDEPVMIPAFQGSPPTRAFHNSTGPCQWTSDYWLAKDGSVVFASSVSYVVTPSGEVHARSWYPAEPLVCE